MIDTGVVLLPISFVAKGNVVRGRAALLEAFPRDIEAKWTDCDASDE